MNVVLSSDWHGDWTTLGIPRFDEVAAAAEHTVDYAISTKAGLYVFGGDLAETEGPGMLRTLELAVRLATKLNAAGIPSLWLTGNHDVIEDGRCTSNLTPLRDVPGATLADAPVRIAYGQPSARSGSAAIRVLALPFTPRTHSYDPAAFVREHAHEAIHLVVGHLMLEGIGPGSETRDMPRGRDVFLPVREIREAWPNAVIASGHYHTRQVFNGVHIPGSLCRLMQVEANNPPSFLEMHL